MPALLKPLVVSVILSVTGAGAGGAWVAGAHARVAEEAVRALPDSVPPFFRAGFFEIGRSAIDPDYYRLRDLPQLRNAESPEHYLDSELLEGAEWPETRSEFLKLVAGMRKDVYFVGTLPYSVAEGVQRLAASFAQVRLNPSDKWAQAKALHHAGILAHYTADLCQPLHTTIHFNGRARADGSSPSSGIHFQTDSLADAVFAEGVPAVGAVAVAEDLRGAIHAAFSASHARVDRVYQLEDGLGPESISPEAMVFARERVAASIRFTSSMLLTAWEISGDLSLPDWFLQLQPVSAPSSSASPR